MSPKSQRPARGAAREALLDTAERLFAEKGYDGVPIRELVDEAQVNLGALHYYWGSKAALFEATWKRRMEPLSLQRQRRLDQLEAEYVDRPIPIVKIIRIWLEVGLEVNAEGGEPSKNFQRLYGRALTDPSPVVQRVVRSQLGGTSQRLVELLRRACPELSDTELYWRVHALLGAVLWAHIGQDHLRGVNWHEIDTAPKEGVEILTAMLVAGFSEPAVSRPAAVDRARKSAGSRAVGPRD